MLNDHPAVCCDGEPLLRLGRVTADRSARAQTAALDAVLGAFASGGADASGVLRPCKRKGAAAARGFKWFDGQGGAFLGGGGAPLANLTAWIARHRVRLIVLERQGLAKYVSDRLKHKSHVLGVRAVPTHCRDAACVDRVNAQRLRLGDRVASDLAASVAGFGRLLDWARGAVAFGDLLYVRYRDLAADPAREARRVYAHLGVDARHAANASLLLKSVTAPLRSIIENYDDVAAQLREGGWDTELDDPPKAPGGG